MINLGILNDLIIYEILMAVLLFGFSIIFAVRYRQRQRKAIKYLSLTYLMFTFGALFAAYGHLVYTKYWFLILMDYAIVPYLLTGYFIPIGPQRMLLLFDQFTFQLVLYLEGYFITLVYQWSAALIAAMIGHLFIFLFTLEAFKEVKRKYIVPYLVLLAIVLASLLFNIQSITINWALAFMLGLITQGLLSYYAIKAMRLTDSKLYKRGFLLVSITAVLFILFFLSYLIDSVTGGWTIFLFVGWTLALVSAVPTYIGYLMPDWFRRRYE
ncbi:MAG: hypothetical protein ACUVXA_14275 [Candidatus Jordarchaeum sp.]|uniref:hypothetical protein n=1 Tax=Candidatus Jordarchaeum sp. TaxID=2823881 RepID=UPI00404BA096